MQRDASAKLTPLCCRYKDELYWWEGVVICRRILCILAAVFATSAFAQSSIMLFIILLFLVVQARTCRPSSTPPRAHRPLPRGRR